MRRGRLYGEARGGVRSRTAIGTLMCRWGTGGCIAWTCITSMSRAEGADAFGEDI